MFVLVSRFLICGCSFFKDVCNILCCWLNLVVMIWFSIFVFVGKCGLGRVVRCIMVEWIFGVGMKVLGGNVIMIFVFECYCVSIVSCL